jgi:histidinol-phosphate/aromatic aminotransferase/cobyric acid decarboxylase-like protein
MDEPGYPLHPEARPELRDLVPAVHGGDAPPGVLDFSTGVSPLPPPPSLLSAFAGADVTRYPHPSALPLTRAIAERHGVDVEQVVAGAGSVELIWALVRAFGGPGRRVAYLQPAFAEYAQAARASGASVDAVSELSDPRAAAASLLFVARPANPTLAVPELGDARARLLVVDEAYLPLCAEVAPTAPSETVAVLRSLTKVFALPGLRLGYLLAAPAVARAVQASLPPWNVSQPAIAVGLAALAEDVAEVRRAIDRLRQRLCDRLCATGRRVVAARGSLVLVEVADARTASAGLLARGCRVRDCSSFGLPRHVRIGVRPEAEQEQLILAWQELGE